MHHLEYGIHRLAVVLEEKENNKQLADIAYALASESHNYEPDKYVKDEKMQCVKELELLIEAFKKE